MGSIVSLSAIAPCKTEKAAKDVKKMQRFAKLMRALAKLICILLVDYITLQTIVERYEMKVSVRICCSIIIFFLLLLATMWLDKEKNEAEMVTKTAWSVFLAQCQ
ncbi:MAG: hypothetical protein IKZ82_09195 [Clostridia bacterium]|nr:hypothetical protein [Clostridia bacterium]